MSSKLDKARVNKGMIFDEEEDDGMDADGFEDLDDEMGDMDQDAFLRRSLMRGHLDDDDEDDDNPLNWNMNNALDDEDDLDEMDDHFSPEDRAELQSRIRQVIGK